MFLIACGFLFVAGLVLNSGDRRMLALTALVGASIFVPVPNDTALQFYAFCIAVEVLVGLLAYSARAPAGALVVDICALLAITHVLGYALDGHPPFSPYRYIVKLLELSQLAACMVLSPSLAPILRNRNATTI